MKKIRDLYNSKKSVTTDFIYTVGATVVLNVVLQIIVFPLINKISGQETLGNVTYYMSIVNIISLSIGTSACNNRLAINQKIDATNGDFLLYLLSVIPIGLIGLSVVIYKHLTIFDWVMIALLTTITCVRSYCQVQFRLVLSYQKYFIMFLLCSIGYLVGILFYWLIGYWQLIFIIGEFVGCVFVFFTGNVLHPNKKSNNFSKVFSSTFTLTSSMFIYEITTNADRLILKNFDSANAVSLYYTVSSVPKILYMLSQPINNIVLSYVANKKLELSKKTFIKLTATFSGLGVVFYLGSIIGIPIFMKILYSNIWEQGKPFMFTIPIIVIIDLICSMIANLIFAKFGSKYHLMIFGSFLLYYAPLAIIGTQLNGIKGFVQFAIIAEVIKYVLIVIFGIIKYTKDEKSISINKE